MTPLYALIVVAFLLALVALTCITVTVVKLKSLRHRQKEMSHNIEHEQRDFEKEHHLIITPPVGTYVLLLADSSYLSEYHGARPGQIGTVIERSRLNSDDTGVLVDWDLRPCRPVRMDLDELRLAPPAESDAPL